jgi:general secretion pathway protein C
MPAPSAVPVVPARYTLAGVMAVGRDGHTGVALIATDGQKAKPYRVGADVDGRWRVQSVSARTVVLSPLPSVVHAESQGPMTLTLPVPAFAPQGGQGQAQALGKTAS